MPASRERSTAIDAAHDSPTNGERILAIDQNPAASATVSARIAGIAIAADYPTTNDGTQNRSDHGARGRAAADSAFVTTRRRTARIGYRDRLRTRGHRSRIVGNRLRRYRLRLSLGDSGRRCGLHDLRRSLGSRLMVPDAS